MAPLDAVFVVLLGAGAGGVGVRGDVALEIECVFGVVDLWCYFCINIVSIPRGKGL